MNGDTRRDLIQNSMQHRERLALEAHIIALKKAEQNEANRAHAKNDNLALCDTESSESTPSKEPTVQKGRGGICKSADDGKVYGYYAKVTFNNLIFTSRVHPQLEDAVRDHIILLKIYNMARHENEDARFIAKVRFAVLTVLADEGLREIDFFRSVAVVCSACHWIGRSLSVFFASLDGALEAWNRFDQLQTPKLFEGGRPTIDYTPQRATQQWAQLKDAYIDLQAVRGREHRIKVAQRLARMEAAHRPVLHMKTQRWAEGLSGSRGVRLPRKKAADTQETLLERFWKVLSAWRRDKLTEERVKARQQKAAAKLQQKRRWDGKESLENFHKRMRAGNI